MNINDKLYRCLFTAQGTALWHYTIKEIRQSEETTLYVVECGACSHGTEKCRILISKFDENSYQYVGMVNNEDHDYWHKDYKYGDKLFKTEKLAKEYYYRDQVEKYKEELTKARERVKFLEKVVADMQIWIEK